MRNIAKSVKKQQGADTVSVSDFGEQRLNRLLPPISYSRSLVSHTKILHESEKPQHFSTI